MVIELAGLPGAGKTTICRQITVPHRRKDSVPLSELRIWPDAVPFAWYLFLLCLSARPIRWSRWKRGINVLALLRCYRPHSIPVVLDQGLVQKIWSILLDAEIYSKPLLIRVIKNVKPFAPQYLVHVETPIEAAALRVSLRSHGNSRFDCLSREEITISLKKKERLLNELRHMYQLYTGVRVLGLDGRDPAEHNSFKIDRLLRNELIDGWN
jgi:hypothetical protein